MKQNVETMDLVAQETKVYKYCLRCGKRLKTPENQARGMGKTCWEKSQLTLKSQKNRLFFTE